MKTRKKRKKRTSGSLLVRCLILVVLAVSSFAAGAPAEKQKRAPLATALIAGTVFRESGLSLAGAELVLEPLPAPGKSSKMKKMKAVADSRGEFALRVPAVAMDYKLFVNAAGYETWDKQISVQSEDRIDLTVVLKPRQK
jgi:hypothetical protein